MLRFRWTAPLLVGLGSLALQAQVKVTYLANEGVMLEAGNAKVLVDALLRDSLGDYHRYDAATQEKIEHGKPPFDGVSLALATHFHLDHWDAGAISQFLKHSPAALFASTPQATGMIPFAQRKQVRQLWPGESAATVEVVGVKVDAVPLDHRPAQNLGYRIQMGGRTLFHAGDSGPDDKTQAALMASPPPDVAMVPFWWLLDPKGLEFVTKTWKPKHIVAFHFGVDDIAKSSAKIRESVPGAWLCLKQGESRVF
ncbi:MAG: MBL fold metallo-hydrolase [Bryobacteraceae bacterium]